MSGGSWYSADEKWKLPDSEILKAIACAHPKFFIGCRAGKASRFAVLDIDQKSKYHNKQSLDKLLKALCAAGITRSSLYRSSFSGGWHLYIFFDEPISSADLRQQLLKLLLLNDFQVGKGQLEMFPHPGGEASLGLGLRLPLQPGFAWLDKKTLEVQQERHELDAPQALELFIDVLDGDANSYAAFRQLKAHVEELAVRKNSAQDRGRGARASNVVPLKCTERTVEDGEFTAFVQAVFQKLPPGIIADNWYKGRIYHLNGLSGPSQRAEAIECVGHYLFYGDPSRQLPALGYGYEQERQWALEEFLRARNNGQSEEINKGRSDAFAQAERAAHWRPAHKQADEPRKYAPTQPVAWIRSNAKRQRDARTRISAALDGLKVEARYFTTDELRKAAKCSKETLYKHQDIWQKDYEDLASGFFAISTDEYNDVVGAGSTQTKPPTTSLEQDMPPGRLAARRIAYEISMRSARQKDREHKEAVRSQEAHEKDWTDKVNQAAPNDPESLSVQELKAVLVVLLGYLAMAPNYECQRSIETRINLIRDIYQKRVQETSFSLVRGP